MQYTQWVITPQITWMSIKSFVLLSLNDLCSIIHSSASGESKADGSANNLGTKMHKEIVTAENSPSVGVARNFQKVGADLKNKNQMLSASLQLNSLKLKIFLWHVTQGNIPKFQSTICISANLAENSTVKKYCDDNMNCNRCICWAQSRPFRLKIWSHLNTPA